MVSRNEMVSDFIKEAHPLTLEYINDELMSHLKRVDTLAKMQEKMKQIRRLEQQQHQGLKDLLEEL